MTSVQSVSTNNEYKEHYIKPTGVVTSAALGSLYGLKYSNDNCPTQKYLYPLDDNVEEFLSKNPLGKKFVDFMKKSKFQEGLKAANENIASRIADDARYSGAEVLNEAIDTLKTNKGSIGTLNLPKGLKLDTSLATKGALLFTGIYAVVKLTKKGLDYLDKKMYRS